MLGVILVAFAAGAGAGDASPTPDGGPVDTSAPRPVDTSAVKDTVLVLGPRIAAANEVVNGLTDELADHYQIVERTVTAETSAETLAQIIRELEPRALVLLDNPTVRRYRAFQAAQPPGTPFPPAVVLMAAFLEQASAGLQNATGISYEVPAVTGFVNLRSLLGRPLRKIGVLYRRGFEGFVARQGELAAAEGFTLAERTLDEGDRLKAVKRGLRRLLDYDHVDAIWVLNDSALLCPELLARAWLPVLRHGHVPVMVGVPSLVSAKLAFGTFAVLPDHRALGRQAAGLIDNLAEANWAVGAHRPLLPVAVEKVLDVGMARTLAPIREEKLREIDRLIETGAEEGQPER
jgi:hypothetical protein